MQHVPVSLKAVTATSVMPGITHRASADGFNALLAASRAIFFRIEHATLDAAVIQPLTREEGKPLLGHDHRAWENTNHVSIAVGGTIPKTPPFKLQGDCAGFENQIWKQHLASSFALQLHLLILATNIAVPGGLGMCGGPILFNGKRITSLDHFSSSITDLPDGLRKFPWPPLSDLSVTQVFSWLQTLPGLDEGTGRGPIGRAVAALAHALSSNHQHEQTLLWCLLGLEAIYGRDEGSKGAQLTAKSEVLLGSIRTHKKELNSAYSVRSRFVHGAIDIPLPYSPFDGTDEYERFHDQNSDAANYACAVLISSLQAFCVRGLQDVAFRWELAPKQDA